MGRVQADGRQQQGEAEAHPDRDDDGHVLPGQVLGRSGVGAREGVHHGLREQRAHIGGVEQVRLLAVLERQAHRPREAQVRGHRLEPDLLLLEVAEGERRVVRPKAGGGLDPLVQPLGQLGARAHPEAVPVQRAREPARREPEHPSGAQRQQQHAHAGAEHCGERQRPRAPQRVDRDDREHEQPAPDGGRRGGGPRAAPEQSAGRTEGAPPARALAVAELQERLEDGPGARGRLEHATHEAGLPDLARRVGEPRQLVRSAPLAAVLGGGGDARRDRAGRGAADVPEAIGLG